MKVPPDKKLRPTERTHIADVLQNREVEPITGPFNPERELDRADWRYIQSILDNERNFLKWVEAASQAKLLDNGNRLTFPISERQEWIRAEFDKLVENFF